MQPFTISDLADIIGAEKINFKEDIIIKNITTDSRSIPSDALFVALRGERFDGHDFIKDIAHTALCVVAEKETDADIPQLIVKDTVKALGLIGKAAKERAVKAHSLERTVGVTGSVGKTTTKEFISCVLHQRYKTFCTPGNFNNHIGLPLTLCSMPYDTEQLVCEMGMSGRGEIDYLSSLCTPDIAVITNIGVSHIENLGSREAIREAKLEMVSHMAPGSLVILNGDEPLLRDERARELLEGKKVIYAGFDLSNDIYPKDILSGGGSVSFDVIYKDHDTRLTLPVIGDHFVLNALFAYAVGTECGIAPDEIRKGLGEYKTTGLRQKVYTKNNVRVIADCYNAGPESMEAALKVLGGFTQRKIAVLSDMLELGLMTNSAHINAGKQAARAKADELLLFGRNASLYKEGAILEGMKEDSIRIFSNADELAEYLKLTVKPEDTVLFKASRRMRLEDIIEKAGLGIEE